MSEYKFIKYVGDYRIHDSTVKEVVIGEDSACVSLIDENNDVIKIEFHGVDKIVEKDPVGMIIYSITEFEEDNKRGFSFVNTYDEDEDDACLIIFANICRCSY